MWTYLVNTKSLLSKETVELRQRATETLTYLSDSSPVARWIDAGNSTESGWNSSGTQRGSCSRFPPKYSTRLSRDDWGRVKLLITLIKVDWPSWRVCEADILCVSPSSEQSQHHKLTTVEPRFNEPLFNEVLDITNDILCPGQSYSKMYGIEPRCNEPLYNEFFDITNIIRKPKRKIYLDITNYNVSLFT